MKMDDRSAVLKHLHERGAWTEATAVTFGELADQLPMAIMNVSSAVRVMRPHEQVCYTDNAHAYPNGHGVQRFLSMEHTRAVKVWLGPAEERAKEDADVRKAIIAMSQQRPSIMISGDGNTVAGRDVNMTTTPKASTHPVQVASWWASIVGSMKVLLAMIGGLL